MLTIEKYKHMLINGLNKDDYWIFISLFQCLFVTLAL